MSITDLADDKLGTIGGVDLSNAGPNCQRIAEASKSSVSSSSLIATIFWQAFMNSDAYFETLKTTGISSRGTSVGEKFIIRHGAERTPRHDLIIFDPGFLSTEPYALEAVHPSFEELRNGWSKFTQNLGRPPSSNLEIATSKYGGEAAVEALKRQDFGLIVAAPFERTLTALLPVNALGVSHHMEPSIATVGVIARNSRGKEGVTTALHSLNPSVKHAYVGGLKGRIDSQDISAVTDSCFIEVPGIGITYGIPHSQLLAGPLKGVPPGYNQPVSFIREGAGWIPTRVIGWDPDIPLVVTAKKQLQVLTDPVTQKNDSGVALIDSTNHVVGFAFLTAGAGSGYSSWIWAESVFEVHELL